MRLIIVSGRSGSGKSTALDVLEDNGFYCIDNLPAGLLPELAERALLHTEVLQPQVAVSIDARNLPTHLQRFPELLAGEGAALLAGLADEDGANRGLAAWVTGLVRRGVLQIPGGALAALANDATEVTLFLDGELLRTTTGQLARQALARLGLAQDASAPEGSVS